MDATSLYPSLRIGEVCKILEEVIDDAPIKFEEVEYKEIGKYLIVKLTINQIKDHGIEKFLPQRYTNRGKPSVKYLEKDRIYTKKLGANPQEPDVVTFQPPGKRARVADNTKHLSSTPTKDDICSSLFFNKSVSPISNLPDGRMTKSVKFSLEPQVRLFHPAEEDEDSVLDEDVTVDEDQLQAEADPGSYNDIEKRSWEKASIL